MDIYGKIAKTIKAMGAAQGVVLFTAEVDSVEDESCTVKIGTLELTDVRLRAVLNSESDKIVVTPKRGSRVLVADMSGGSYIDLVVLSYSEIEKVEVAIEQTTYTIDKDGIVMNGGNNGGLINIQELTDKLNDLITAFNTHTHGVQSFGNSSATGTLAKAFNASDYEDTKVKH